RGSMLLYRLASDDDAPTLPASSSVSSRDSAHLLPPPKLRDHAKNRDSTSSGISFASLDSKYPLKPQFPWRGIMNMLVLVLIILALLCLFVFYPVLTFHCNKARNARINGTIRINATGALSPLLFGTKKYLNFLSEGDLQDLDLSQDLEDLMICLEDIFGKFRVGTKLFSGETFEPRCLGLVQVERSLQHMQ
ncbi:hypothetical protein C0991_007069, partial [Blastosporella zonata]